MNLDIKNLGRLDIRVWWRVSDLPVVSVVGLSADREQT